MSIQNLISQGSTQSITKTEDFKQFPSKKGRKALQSTPSDKLNHLMELVNGLPATAKSWDEIMQAAEKLSGTPLKELDREVYIFRESDPDRPILAMEAVPNLFKDQVEELRSPAKEYVGPIHMETAMTLFYQEPYAMPGYRVEDTMAMAMVRYERLIRARKILIEIAEKSALINQYRRFYLQTGIWPAVTTLLTTVSNLNISLHINEKGQIAVKPDKLLDALLGTDAERIRQCPICNNIFWASRIDQRACSKRCSNTMRVRRSRELNQERGTMYKRARIKKAEHKKLISRDSKRAGTTKKSSK